MKLIKPNFEESIMNVSNSFLHHYQIHTNYPGIKELNIELSKNYNHIIYVLLDGMGVNVINKHLKESDLLKKHLVKTITSVFPPTTVAATNSVLSGLPPISTGYIGWVQYFKEEDTDLAVFLNQDFYTDKKFDELLRDKYLKYDNIMTKISNKHPDVITNRLFPSFIEDGTCESLHDAVEQALVITHNTDKSFTYLYWTQPDLIEHHAGVYSHDVKKMMKNINKDFEELCHNISEDTLIVTIADHGLVDVTEINLYEYKELMDMLKRKPSIEPRACNFFVKDDYIDDFKTEFNKHFEGKYILLNKKEIFESNTFGIGEKHPLVDMFIGDYMAISVSEYMFKINDSKAYKAHHAGLTEEEMMVPLIIYKK